MTDAFFVVHELRWNHVATSFLDVAIFLRRLTMGLQELVERSWAIRQAYHELEVKYHDSK